MGIKINDYTLRSWELESLQLTDLINESYEHNKWRRLVFSRLANQLVNK